jgi:hypothetical protein
VELHDAVVPLGAPGAVLPRGNVLGDLVAATLLGLHELQERRRSQVAAGGPLPYRARRWRAPRPRRAAPARVARRGPRPGRPRSRTVGPRRVPRRRP